MATRTVSLDDVEFQVVKACLNYCKTGFERSLAKAQSENVAAALRKDVEAVRSLILKFEKI